MTFGLRTCAWGVGIVLGFASLAIILGLYMLYDVTHRGHNACGEEYECNHRLSSDVVPSSYHILLHPNLAEGTFTGRVTIELETLQPRKNLFLHSKGLAVNRTEIAPRLQASLGSGQGQPLGIARTFEYPKNEFWVIKPTAEIPAGKYALTLEFSGKLTGKIIGFYRSVYTDKATGKEVPIATSKFEPTFARQAFPCMDEPAFKAKFSIQLVRPSDKNYIALSNMNQVGIEEDKPSAGLTTVTFAESVPMSTYLACFIVCDFKRFPADNTSISAPKASVPINAYARPGQEMFMKYAHFVGVNVIDFYVKYFNIDYPLPKLDIIGIPDFVSGAMEHWGLVTFRETSVLYTPNESSLSNKKRISLTVAHELAHMWFGNLVTMKWWNDLWLNEGFASYIEYKGVNSVHPDWDIDTQFLHEELFGVLTLDCQLSSHPIVQNVNHPDQITEIFDFISYSKGSSVIRMLEAFMGEQPFQQGVVSYLTSNKYGNAETKDLWDHLQKFAGDVKVADVMGTWTKQMGYPVVNVKRSGNKLTLSQKRFLPDKSESTTEMAKNMKLADSKWDVPIMYYTSADPKVKLAWLPNNQDSTTIDVEPGTSWVKINYRNYGYYRVNYDADAWSLFSSTLDSNPHIFNAADRASLLNDAFSLAKASHLSYSVPLNLCKYIKSENHSVPIAVVLDKFKDIKELLRDTPIYDEFLAFGRKNIVLPDDVWNFTEDTSFLEGEFKSTLLNLACLLEIPECTSQASKIFLSWLTNNGPKPYPDLRSLVYNTGMRANSTEEVWSKLWEKYLAETTPSEKLKLMVALTTPRNKQILETLIQNIKNESYIRSQDYFIVLNLIGKNPVGTELVWDFMRSEWQYLVDRFTLNDRAFGRLIPNVCSSFTTKERLQEMKEFFAGYPEAGAGAAGRARALETVNNNIEWLATHYKSIENFLKQKK
nr:PREDICTED: glutamyl aminopeptidase-like isoform X3 [Bemisia tabaci]